MKVLKFVHVHTLLKGDGWFEILFCILLKDGKGNPKPEHEWPSENYWKVIEQEQVSHQLRLFKFMHQSFETPAPDPRDLAGNLTLVWC